MWRKYMRTMQYLTYRKKYKCPKCNEYCLHIIHDSACECEDCDLEEYQEKEIKTITVKDDFNGYYTKEEIKYKFGEIDDDEINKIFKKITDVPQLKKMSKKQKGKIENLYCNTVEIDEKLDDLLVIYFNKNNITKNAEFTSFSYIITLIEDIHHFLNICCNDLILFYYGIEFAEKHFYSGRFFFNNCIDHISLADERIYVFLAIFYNYNFSQDLSKNRTFKIKEFLKNNIEFKNSKLKKILDDLHSSSEISMMRKYNTHDINYSNLQVIKDIEKNPANINKYNNNANVIDEEFFVPQMLKTISIIEQYYDILYCLINMIQNQNFEEKEIPMLKLFIEDFSKNKITVDPYKIDFSNNMHKEKYSLYKKLIFFNSQYIHDTFFRIDEITHCITDIFMIENNSFYINWDNHCILHIGFIDKQYLLYSCITRLFSCYDKIAKYLSEKIEIYSQVTCFSDFENYHYKNNDRISKKITDILIDKNYLLLIDLRNNFYHNLRPGCIGGKEGLNHFNNVMTQAVFENTKIIFSLLNFLIPNNDCNIAPNDLCPCGSLIKYKKCCKNKINY